MSVPQLLERAALYCRERQCVIVRELGSGTDGSVWETNRRTAVKSLILQKTFHQELESYRRLFQANMTEICGFAVPRLIDYSIPLLTLEIDIVQPPRILDFGKVTLDQAPDFSEQTMADWNDLQQDLWGEHWPTIQKILARLRSLGIYYSDPNPYNITPEDWNPEL
ncbi:hypothetical protein NA78x_006236 [Anatilimnocola sp. NA78]|uniref:hypothetical protein n=1 Tax=Anatilimnocola sp. NA78 TaxID=3415683 RepID=UPI003CE598BC